MKTINGKIIAITGASSGIGHACAKLAVRMGATPILLARSTGALQELKDELTANAPATRHYELDVTNEEQVNTVVNDIIARYGQIDIWVNNAGYGIFSPFTESTLEDVQGMMDVNYMGTVRCMKAVLPHMLKRKSGHIINVASVAGKMATAKSSAYSASKFAVIGLTASVRQELKGTGITISAVNPGPVRTPFFDRADKAGTYRRNIESFMVTPEAVAQAILKTVETGKAETTIPRYMNAGIVLSHLLPGMFDRFISSRLNKK
ncbi:SDR family NAD(P)-dependent oxidoreductase [Aneurinibacillus tyrosinisolvens]|uniref:SDR family NAD(P)-dependent oxidoreductase n=1 Tax=Aneurinibacillus tyrosinisolvens TaxID=1443435 RepID=UPI00069B9344|nr:SDR family oxidoreductase [Aneurinibacillus tyrosinisolvens]